MLTAVKNQLGVHIRWMIKRDLPDILQIESTNSQMASPLGAWCREDFLRILGDRRSNVGMVAEWHESIVGFFVYNLQPDKLHIWNMAVSPDHLGVGVGTQMMDRLKAKLRKGRRESLEIDVREYDLCAQLFLKSQGFRCVETSRGWFEAPKAEDAYKFKFFLTEESC